MEDRWNGTHKVSNAVHTAQVKADKARQRGLTRDTRATVDGVLDPRSLQILGKFKRAGFYTKLFGCISTGKEANVYAATVRLSLRQNDFFEQQLTQAPPFLINDLRSNLSHHPNSDSIRDLPPLSPQEGEENGLRREDGKLQREEQRICRTEGGVVEEEEKVEEDEVKGRGESGRVKVEVFRAIKVYKTSILIFKNRHQYVEGEFRFKSGFKGSSNPRKMVKQWAEKEFRNLRRLSMNGLRCPTPVTIRGHVLVMSLVGSAVDVTAPRLKDFRSSDPLVWRRLYIEALALARSMLQRCKLVHGDLSEYNLLIFKGHLYIIDVSQSMEYGQCHALQFLKRDCVNLTAFFRKIIDPDCPAELDAEEEEHGKVALNINTNWEEDDQSLSDFSECPADEIDNTSLAEGDLGSHLNNHRACCEVNDPEVLKRAEAQFATVKDSLNSLHGTLTAEEAYEYMLLEELPKASAMEWPDFDLDDCLRALAIERCGDRFRGSEPLMAKKNLAKNDIEDDHEGEIVDGLKDEPRRQVKISSFCQERTNFNECCAETLAYVCEKIRNRPSRMNNPIQKKEDVSLFLQTPLADSLHELRDLRALEREIDHVKSGGVSKYAELMDLVTSKSCDCSEEDEEEEQQMLNAEDTEVKAAKSNVAKPNILEDAEENVLEEEEATTCSSDSDENELGGKFDGHIPEGISRKEWKARVKEEKRERRKTKMKKNLKKSIVKKRKR